MRKSAVLTVGNYRSIGGAEDYDLWVRMLLKNMQARNLADVLVYARIGNGMQQRRGGCHYAKSAIQLQRIFYREHFINPFEFFRNGLIRLCASLLPSTARTKLYRSALRDKNTKWWFDTLLEIRKICYLHRNFKRVIRHRRVLSSWTMMVMAVNIGWFCHISVCEWIGKLWEYYLTRDH